MIWQLIVPSLTIDGQSLGKQGSGGNSPENDLSFSSQETM